MKVTVVTGVFSFVGCHLTREFARSMASQLRLDTVSMRSGPCVEMPQKARRPLDMTMAADKYQRAFGVSLPRIEDEVQLLAKEYV
jgi:dTDP-4-dehydrorhamnose reductase